MINLSPKAIMIAALLVGGAGLAQPAFAGQYDKAMAGCHAAIQAKLSIPAAAYKHKLTHIKAKARTVELWYDVSNRADDDTYTAQCKARKSSGQVTALTTNAVSH